jgi:hypothetical protein
MKAWASLALVAWIVLYLLLSLAPQAILPSGNHYGTCRNQAAASSLLIAWVVAAAVAPDAVAALREAVVRNGVLTTHALGPPGGEIHGLPEIAKGLGQLAAKLSGQSNEPSTLLWGFYVCPPRQS